MRLAIGATRGDFVDAMWKMLRGDFADDYVVATGESHSVREFCELALGQVGIDYESYMEPDRNVQRARDREACR